MIATHNPLLAIEYKKSYRLAKEYILQNCYWSNSTYYRKMNSKKPLSQHENDVIVTAFKTFIYPHFQQIIPTFLHN